jgi:hypothetical protein
VVQEESFSAPIPALHQEGFYQLDYPLHSQSCRGYSRCPQFEIQWTQPGSLVGSGIYVGSKIGDIIEMVTKWLAVPVADYLDSGSPLQDYTLSTSAFIKSKQGNIDVGAMFNNFRVHLLERHTLEVHTLEVQVINTALEGEYEHHKVWHFCALHFGGRPSPYLACQSHRIILQLCKGDRHDINNHWQLDTVRLNLPGLEDYDPSMPQVMLLQKDGELATREAHYVDNIYPCVCKKKGSNQARRCAQLKSQMNAQGNHDDDQKYRLPTFTPEAWNDVTSDTDTPFPMMSTTRSK